MKKLLPLFKEYRGRAILAPLFKLTEAIFELLVPLVVAKIIDHGIFNGDVKYIINNGILMILLGVIGFTCALVAQYFSAVAAVGFAGKIRSALFKKIQSFEYTQLDKISSSTLITRLTSDVNQLQTGVNISLRLLLRSPFIVFGAMIMAFTVDVKSALIFVACIPLLTIIVLVIMAITVPLYKKAQSKLDNVLLKSRENIHGAKVLRAFCKENDEITDFKKENNQLYYMQNFVGKIASLMNPLTYVVINFAVIIIISFGSKQVNNGALTQGQIVALYNYMSQILVELIKLANMIITINKSLASASRIESILSVEISNDVALNEKSDKYIEFKNVDFKYSQSSEYSLIDINFTVDKGQTIGIIGPTGSGKSTLINLLPHFYGATEGAVLINGVDVKSIENSKLRKMIGFVPQKNVLFKGTIRQNLLLGGKLADDDKLLNAVKIAVADEIIDKKGGLDAFVEQGGKNLSGGQRQRLCIARALVGNPEIIILDDSASALDFKTEALLRDNLAKLSHEHTLFIVSQRVSSIMHADKIIVMDDGKIAGIGKHEDLIKSCDIYCDICSSQLGTEE